ncbi:MAG: response regulator [Desulfobulbaceae bacterium]|jgi:putative two-component system response regulator|nr:response regulator [Desulfobulbaceae bacterium]
MTEPIEGSILAVDDNRTNLDILVNVLSDQHDLSVATDGGGALRLATANPPDLILLDIMMPDMDGFQVMRKLKENRVTRDIPVIFLTALSDVADKSKGFQLGAVDYITKPFQIEEVMARVNIHLRLRKAEQSLRRFTGELTQMVEHQVEQIQQSQLAMIFALAKLSNTRDDDTGMHLERVQYFCQVLAETMATDPAFSDRITPRFIDTIFHSSPLHDVGKVGIADAILLKPARLTPDEFEVMKTHTLIGADTLASVYRQYPENQFVEMGIEIARFHHEKWNGSGYPDGLVGESIPLSARIMAVVDVYDALRARRPYKEPFSHEVSMTIIRELNGVSFDPAIMAGFEQVHSRFEELYSRLSDAESMY